jgi:hypothetical protein
MLVLALLCRVLCSERPSDISLYHLGCFKLQAPDHSSTNLAALALAALQHDAAHTADEMLEAFRAVGAVLLIKAPKCKQSERKRGRGRAAPLQRIDWLSVRKHRLPPQLSMWDPARLVVLCLMASWFSRGSIGARLLLNMRFGSSKAGPKRQQQPDFQADVSAGCWKVVTAGDLHGSTPTLYLISSSSSSSASKCSADAGSGSGSGSEGDDEDDAGAKLSSSLADEGSNGNAAAATAAEAAEQQQCEGDVLRLVHRKPRGGKDVLLQLKPLTGYDVRHSVQKCAVQCGVRLAVSAQLASHSTEEALKYAANSCYEAVASTGTPIKLVRCAKSCSCWLSACSLASLLVIRQSQQPCVHLASIVAQHHMNVWYLLQTAC